MPLIRLNEVTTKTSVGILSDLYGRYGREACTYIYVEPMEDVALWQ